MATEFRIPATAVVATLRSLRLVDQMRILLDVTDRLAGDLDDANQAFERTRGIINAKLVRAPIEVKKSARPATVKKMVGKMVRASNLELARACCGWTGCYASAERSIGDSVKAIDALLADIGNSGCRAIAAHLFRVQPVAVKFPGYSPCAWEMETARTLAIRCLGAVRQFIDANPTEPGADEPEEFEGAINRRKNLVHELRVILHGRDDLDRLEAAIAADLAELNAAVDAGAYAGPRSDIEPKRYAELAREAQTLRANLIEGAAIYPDGGIHLETDDGVSVALFGMSPAGAAHLQAICEHAEPVLRALGANIGERGETADGRLLRWAGEMVAPAGGDHEHGNPFAFLAVAISRFMARAEQPAERAPAKVAGHVVDVVLDGSPEQRASGGTTDKPLGATSQDAENDQTPENDAQTNKKRSGRGRFKKLDTTAFLEWAKSGRWDHKMGPQKNCEAFAIHAKIPSERMGPFVAKMRAAYYKHLHASHSAGKCAPNSLRADK
jgi:hypothetical protein